MRTLQGLAMREARKAKKRHECEARGGHYYIRDGVERMPDNKDYPRFGCECGAIKLEE